LTKLFQSQHKLLFEQIDAKAGEHGNDWNYGIENHIAFP
jgi:hypothetical protein